MSGQWSDRKLHFAGIGGAGMSGVALIAAGLGAEVTGSDRFDTPYMARLRAIGVEPVIGYAAGNVPADAEVVYSTAVPAENPERAVAAGRELHRADLLAQIAALKRCIAVTGTHGKTTTTAMIAHVLRICGMDPGYVIGGELIATGSNAGWGNGDWIVIEADESDRSLLKLTPEIAVLTNAELDHHATYASLDDLRDTFRRFLASATHQVVWDRPELAELAPSAAVSFDAIDPQLDAGGSRFRWEGHEVALRVPGVHNAVNAAGALSACALAGAPPEQAATAIASFGGARRRMERLGVTPAGQVPVYDDYAHHPTEVAAIIAASRTLTSGRVVAVFQPHLFSRTRALARDFGAALARADIAAVLDVYPARERPEDFPGVTGLLVAQAAADARPGHPVAWLPGFEDVRRFLVGALRPGDLCVMMGAGNIDSLARSLVT